MLIIILQYLAVCKANLVECMNLHDFRYDGGAPINSGFQIPLISHKYKNGPSYQARTI